MLSSRLHESTEQGDPESLDSKGGQTDEPDANCIAAQRESCGNPGQRRDNDSIAAAVQHVIDVASDGQADDGAKYADEQNNGARQSNPLDQRSLFNVR